MQRKTKNLSFIFGSKAVTGAAAIIAVKTFVVAARTWPTIRTYSHSTVAILRSAQLAAIAGIILRRSLGGAGFGFRRLDGILIWMR
jgi:hypothetical protein